MCRLVGKLLVVVLHVKHVVVPACVVSADFVPPHRVTIAIHRPGLAVVRTREQDHCEDREQDADHEDGKRCPSRRGGTNSHATLLRILLSPGAAVEITQPTVTIGVGVPPCGTLLHGHPFPIDRSQRSLPVHQQMIPLRKARRTERHVRPPARTVSASRLESNSESRSHHLLKTFWTAWRDEQVPDGTVVWTSPTGHTYVTRPGSRLLFPALCLPTGELPSVPTEYRPPPGDRGAMMPTRRRTRQQDRAYRIDAERRRNQLAYSAPAPPGDDEPPPF